jgi:hypothetical protein
MKSARTFLRNFVVLRSHCEERLRSKIEANKVVVTFEVNERRSNLPSLSHISRGFLTLTKPTFLQTQSKEIASGMQQH